MELKQTVRTFTGKMYSLSVTDLKAQRHAWERDKQLEELHSGCYVEVYVLFSSFSPPSSQPSKSSLFQSFSPSISPSGHGILIGQLSFYRHDFMKTDQSLNVLIIQV